MTQVRLGHLFSQYAETRTPSSVRVGISCINTEITVQSMKAFDYASDIFSILPWCLLCFTLVVTDKRNILWFKNITFVFDKVKYVILLI